MSHRHERKDKNCLNCGTMVLGRYCQVCGQENVETRETLGSMIHHFFNDITHFDGKFFSTLGYLFRRPGFLPKQYILGRRQKYLNPIRMYVFTSALFFLIFFTLYRYEGKRPATVRLTPAQKTAFIADRMSKASTAEDSAAVQHIGGRLQHELDSIEQHRKANLGNNAGLQQYKTKQEYDSMQALLPAGRRDSWLGRQIRYKEIEKFSKYEGREYEVTESVMNKVLHSVPYILFVSLPLYAFFLFLLYRKLKFYFADHIIYLIHLYIFTFLFMLVLFGLMRFSAPWLNFVKAALILYGIYYALRSMKKFYGQGWGKTVLKFAIFNLACIISLTFLIAIFSGVIIAQI